MTYPTVWPNLPERELRKSPCNVALFRNVYSPLEVRQHERGHRLSMAARNGSEYATCLNHAGSARQLILQNNATLHPNAITKENQKRSCIRTARRDVLHPFQISSLQKLSATPVRWVSGGAGARPNYKTHNGATTWVRCMRGNCSNSRRRS